MSELKNFNDLEFNRHPLAKYAERPPFIVRHEYAESKLAKMDFENGYGISVLLGSLFESNGIDTYEVAVFKNGDLCYAPITNIEIGFITANEVSAVMRQIQELPKT
nr:MAG TPA: hypothetical protein [Caudoviricetes sp.]